MPEQNDPPPFPEEFATPRGRENDLIDVLTGILAAAGFNIDSIDTEYATMDVTFEGVSYSLRIEKLLHVATEPPVGFPRNTYSSATPGVPSELARFGLRVGALLGSEMEWNGGDMLEVIAQWWAEFVPSQPPISDQSPSDLTYWMTVSDYLYQHPEH